MEKQKKATSNPDRHKVLLYCFAHGLRKVRGWLRGIKQAQAEFKETRTLHTFAHGIRLGLPP